MSENLADNNNAIDLDSASIDQLEAMLADAERELHEIREELAERRAQQRHTQMSAVPDDLSHFQGRWRDLIGHLRTIIHE